MRWYEHVLRKDKNDWMKKCMDYEVECIIYLEVGQRKSGAMV